MNSKVLRCFYIIVLISILTIEIKRRVDAIKMLNSTLDLSKKDINSTLNTIISNLPLYVWLLFKSEIIYKNCNDDNILDQFRNYDKRHNLPNKNYSWTQNIIVTGEVLSFKIHKIPIKQDNDFQYIFIAFDITDDEYIRKELNSYLRMYRDLIDLSSNGIAFYSRDTRLVFYNEVFATSWTLEDNWLKSKPTFKDVITRIIERNPLIEINNSEYKKEQLELFHSLSDVKEDFIHLKDGRILKVAIIPNTIGGLLFNYEDITSKFAAETPQNHLMKLYTKVIEEMEGSVAVFSPNHRLYMHNKGFEDLFGLEKDYLSEKPHLSSIIANISMLNPFGEIDKMLQGVNNAIDDIENSSGKIINFHYEDRAMILKIIKMPENLILFLFEGGDC